MLRLILNQGRFVYKQKWMVNQKIQRFSNRFSSSMQEEQDEEEIQQKINEELSESNGSGESGQSEYEMGLTDEELQEKGSGLEQSGSDVESTSSSSDEIKYEIEEETQSEIEDDSSDVEIDSEEVQEYADMKNEVELQQEIPYTNEDIEEVLIDDQDFEEEREQYDKINVSHQDYAFDQRILFRNLSITGIFTPNINEIHLNKLYYAYPIIGDNSDVPHYIQTITQQQMIIQDQINNSIFTQIQADPNNELNYNDLVKDDIEYQQQLDLDQQFKDEQQDKEDIASYKKSKQKKKENEISNQQPVLMYKKLTNYIQDYEEHLGQKELYQQMGQQAEIIDHNYQDYRSLIYDFVKNMAMRNQLEMIKDNEFRYFLMTPEFHGLLPQFCTKSFFLNKPNYLDTQTIIQLLQQTINNPIFQKTLTFIRYAVTQDNNEKQTHPNEQQQFTQADLKNVINILKNHQINSSFNSLAFLFSINQLFGNQVAKQLDQDLILDFISRIYFGPLSHNTHHLIFRQYIKDLIHLQLKVKINPEFQALLLDTFFGNTNYEEAVTKLSLVYIILNKIINGQDNLNHIFQIYINTFGQTNFQFIIVNQLVIFIIIILLFYYHYTIILSIILSLYFFILLFYLFKGRILKQQKFKKVEKVYNQSLNNFNNQKSKEIKIDMNSLDFLEQKLFTKQCQIIYQHDAYLEDEPVHIDSFNQFDSIIQQQGKKLKEKKDAEFMKYYKHLFLENDEKFINSLLKESFVQNDQQVDDFYFQKDKNLSEQNEYLYNKNSQKVNMHMSEIGFKQRKFKDFNYQKQQLNNKNTFGFSNNNTKSNEEQKEEKELNNNDYQTEQINKNTENKEYSKFKRFLKIQEEIDQQKNQQDKPQIDNIQESKQQLKKQKQVKQEQNSDKTKFVLLQNDKQNINLQQQQKPQEQLLLEQSQKIVDEFKTQIIVYINQNNFEEGEEFLKNEIKKIGENKTDKQKYQDLILEINTISQDQKNVIGMKVMINMFLFNKEEKEETSQSLFLDQKVNEDIIQKDFNKYLLHNQFKYQLSNKFYISIFEFLYLQYDRKLFKKTISHFIKYNQNLDPKISKLIALICCKEKIGFSLLEFQLLLVQNKITQSEQALSIQIETLGEFKNLQDYIQDIIIKNVMYQSYDFKFDFVQKYIDKLLQKQQFENIMILFEKIRDYQFSRKANVKQINQENIKEIEKIQEEFKIQNKIKLQSLYREMIVYFNKKQNGLLYSQLLNQDMINNKLSMEEADYINQIDSFRFVPAQIIRIYKNIVIDQNLIITNEILDQFMRVIQLNKQDLKSFFEKLIRDYVFSGNIQISYSNIINVNNTFYKLKQQALFPEYLTHMIQTNILFDKKEYIKDSFIKAFEQCKNESNSVLLNSMIEKLFSLDRKLIIESKSKRLTPEQRETILLQMSLQQKEMMKREGQSIQDKDNEKQKIQAKQSKQNKSAQSAVNTNRLVVEKEIDELEIVSEDLLDKENQIDAEQFEAREQRKSKKSQMTNLERNVKPKSKQKNSRLYKEQLMQAYIFGEIDQEE